MLNKTSWLVVVLCALSCTALPLRADEPPAIAPDFRADIDQLLLMTGAMDIGKQMGSAVATQMAAALKQARPDLPAQAIDAIAPAVEEIIDENIETFRQAVVALYAKHFTHEEVKGMIQFYSTDLGRKTIRVMPELVRDSMLLGQQWGAALAPQFGPKLQQKLRDRGFDI